MTKKRKSPIALSLDASLDTAIRSLAKHNHRTLTAEIATRLNASITRDIEQRIAACQSTLKGDKASLIECDYA